MRISDWSSDVCSSDLLNLLDSGNARVAEPAGEGWRVNQWLKKAVLLSFRLNDNALIPGGPGGSHWWDKVPSKFLGWGERSEEHTSELQSLMRISSAVFCLIKKIIILHIITST